MLSHFSHLQLSAILWAAARQAPLSMGFSRQEFRSGLPCPPPGRLPDPGIEPVFLMSPALTDGLLTASTTWEALWDVPSACLSQHTRVKPPSPPAIACKQDHKPGGRAAKPALRNQSPSLLSPVLRSRIFSSLVFHDKIPFVLPFVLSVLGNGVSEMTSLEKERGEAGRKGKQESVGASKS